MIRLRAAIGFTLAAWFLGPGCSGPKPPPVAVVATVPLAVHRPEPAVRAFPADEEIPPIGFAFEGAPGNVRVTMEIERTSASPAAPTVNDVLFRASGSGRISVGFRRAWPGHDEGRATIRCRSGEEESEAVFEPELWFRHPSAIVTFESPLGEPSNPVAEGREIVLGRYVARNLPVDIRLTLKAVFSKDPIAPRVKAGPRPPR